MIHKKSNRNNIIILLSVIGLIVCISVLFPQIRQMIFDFLAIHIIKKESPVNQVWDKLFFSNAISGICFILFIDYCLLADSGKLFVQKVKNDIKDCLSGIDFRSFLKPAIILFSVYSLGIITIIRANFLYKDDIWRAVDGARGWIGWGRYVSELFSVFIHGDIRLTDISPLTQLIAILFLTAAGLLLVYVIGNRKITVIRLLACIPLGLSPYILECLVFKYDAPYMALSIFASIFPFLFIARKKAFILFSVISLLIMCMTYQAASGIYLLITVMLCFIEWNNGKKSFKEIFSFFGAAVLSFCFALIFYRFFLMRPTTGDYYASTAMHAFPDMIPGIFNNIKTYISVINDDFGIIWKTGIFLVCIFFISKSMQKSAHNKLISFIISCLIIGVSFLSSNGVYFLLAIPSYRPAAFVGLSVFLSIMSIYIVSDFKKIAVITVLALNWCFFVFAFSYGNALADQARYAEFRIGILLHDLSDLYPEMSNDDDITIQLSNSIEFTPLVKNIAKHNPVIERLVPSRLDDMLFDYFYFEYFNYAKFRINNRDALDIKDQKSFIDYNTLNLPVVMDSYYHTIQSDGYHILVILKH